MGLVTFMVGAMGTETEFLALVLGLACVLILVLEVAGVLDTAGVLDFFAGIKTSKK
jgi:hypothetical protein